MPTDLVAGLFGARGSGKSRTVKQYLKAKRPARVLLIDPMNEYQGMAHKVESLADMGRRSAAPAFQLRYVPEFLHTDSAVLSERFRALCALAAVRKNLVLIVEEAQLFTRAAGAPREWAHCTLRGRHDGVSIFCVSQRPAHIDKDFFTNATFLRSGRLNFDDDISVMANALRVPRAAVAGLMGHEWIGRDLLTGDQSCEPAGVVERWRGAPVGEGARRPKSR